MPFAVYSRQSAASSRGLTRDGRHRRNGTTRHGITPGTTKEGTLAGGFVALLATGGTIATVATDGGRTAPAVAARHLAGFAAGLGIEVRAEQVSQRPSWALGLEEMWALALRARDLARDVRCRGVVVTHGTSTLEYGAFYADLALDAATPVVFTGAMRRADDARPDGPRNLGDAARVATSSEARDRGVLVSFAGDILAARDAWKAERTAERAFLGLGGKVGEVTEDRVIFTRRTPRTPAFDGRVEARVAIVKAFPGADAAPLDAAVAGGARGIVLEGLPGAGGIPPRMRDAVARAADRCVLVALASRAPFGRLPDTGGGTGTPLADLTLASAGDLTAEKALVLLSVVLGSATDRDRARREFERVALAKEVT